MIQRTLVVATERNGSLYFRSGGAFWLELLGQDFRKVFFVPPAVSLARKAVLGWDTLHAWRALKVVMAPILDAVSALELVQVVAVAILKAADTFLSSRPRRSVRRTSIVAISKLAVGLEGDRVSKALACPDFSDDFHSFGSARLQVHGRSSGVVSVAIDPVRSRPFRPFKAVVVVSKVEGDLV